MALMAGYTPIASAMLAVLVPIFEPLGLIEAEPDTLFAFEYSPQAQTHHPFPAHHSRNSAPDFLSWKSGGTELNYIWKLKVGNIGPAHHS